MRFLERMCFVVLASGLALGQTAATDSGSAGTGLVADELKALREAISQQQKQISQQQHRSRPWNSNWKTRRLAHRTWLTHPWHACTRNGHCYTGN